MSERTTFDDHWDYNDDVVCPECWGEGGWHDCIEDTCCCLDKDEITHICWMCGGSGYVPPPAEPTP